MRKYLIYITEKTDYRLICFLSYLRDYYDEYLKICIDEDKCDYKVDLDKDKNMIYIYSSESVILEIDCRKTISEYKWRLDEIFSSDRCMRVYSLYSFDGGVGKNTIASSMKRVLANKGEETLIVNYDIFSPALSEEVNMSKLLYLLSTRDNIDLNVEIINGEISAFANPLDFNYFSKDKVIKFFDFLSNTKTYRNIMFVLPRYLNESVIEILNSSDKILIIHDKARYDSQLTRNRTDILKDCKVDTNKIMNIVNKSYDETFLGEESFNIPYTNDNMANRIDRSIFKLINYL